MPVRSALQRQLFALLAAFGLVVICAGSFLPWVRSGTALRNSFEMAGVTDRLGPRDVPLLTATLHAWILIPLASVACIALYMAGVRRTSAWLAAGISVVAGTVGLTTYVLGIDSHGLISLIPAGPLTTGAGGVIGLCAAVVVAVSRPGRDPRRVAGPHRAGAERK